MRISDWSSDVCSSDLPTPKTCYVLAVWRHIPSAAFFPVTSPRLPESCAQRSNRSARADTPRNRLTHGPPVRTRPNAFSSGPRSEEHTSELQSLMRITYADFCLTKKNSQK